MHLEGVVENITVPVLVDRGQNDRQIPLSDAHRSYAQAVHSPCGCSRPGATEHIGLDHLPHVSAFVADWVAEVFLTGG